MSHDFRRAREEMEREIKKDGLKLGMTESQATRWAEKRAREGMERAVNIAHEEGTSSPTEI